MSSSPKAFDKIIEAYSDIKQLEEISPRWDPNWLAMLDAAEKESQYGQLYKFLVKIAPDRFTKFHFDEWEGLRVAQRMFSNL